MEQKADQSFIQNAVWLAQRGRLHAAPSARVGRPIVSARSTHWTT